MPERYRYCMSKKIWEIDYVQAKSGRYQYLVRSEQLKPMITHILRVEDVEY